MIYVFNFFEHVCYILHIEVRIKHTLVYTKQTYIFPEITKIFLNSLK